MRMLVTLCAMCALSMPAAFAQTAAPAPAPAGVTDQDIQLLRSDVQSAKNDIVSHTMMFTSEESAKFTPVYNSYVGEQRKISDDKVQLIKDYAAAYNTIDDAQANSLTQRLLAIDQKTVALRTAYWPKFVKAIGAKRAATFYQVDNRLSLLVALQLASNIPLIQ